MKLDPRDRPTAVAALALFIGIFLLIAWDLTVDYDRGASVGHVVVEFMILMAAAGGALMLLRQLHSVRSGLVRARAEAEQWRRESEQLMQGLSVAIHNQFARWELTPAEASVALFVLKGLSLRDIAELRGTSERTIREQARAVYRKSHLANRSELAAFFLEDLLPPHAGPLAE